MRIFAILSLLMVGQTSCSSAPPAPATEGSNGPAPAPAAGVPCPTDELAFTKEAGCLNDGSVEFCLPSGDEALVARVRAIAPTIQAGASQGRAKCDVPAETLYFFPTTVEGECIARHGALTDAAWDRLCRLAALPEVRAIVPTWYE